MPRKLQQMTSMGWVAPEIEALKGGRGRAIAVLQAEIRGLGGSRPGNRKWARGAKQQG